VGRRTIEQMEHLNNLIKKIMLDESTSSPAKINQILKEQYNENISKQSLLNIINSLSASLTQTKSDTGNSVISLEYEGHPEIKEINTRIEVLKEDFKHAESVADKCKISNELNSTQESKLRMKKTLKEAEMLQRNSDKAQYIITFGEPKVIDKAKPLFKTDDKQKPLPIKETETKE